MLLGGCASPYYKSHHVKTDVQIVARDASLSLALVDRRRDGLRLCLQGAPDATFDQDAAVDLNASLASFGDGGEEEGEGSEQVEMTGRSPALLFAREVFYRTCEAAMSTNASPEEWRAMFTTALQTSAEIMKLEAQNTRIDVKEEDDNRSSSDLTAQQPSLASPPAPAGQQAAYPSSGSPPPPVTYPSTSTNVPPPQ